MAGMNNLLSLQASARGTVRAGSVPQPGTASQAAYGQALSPASGAAPLSPNDAGGIAIWTGIAGVAALVALYYSLPG